MQGAPERCKRSGGHASGFIERAPQKPAAVATELVGACLGKLFGQRVALLPCLRCGLLVLFHEMECTLGPPDIGGVGLGLSCFEFVPPVARGFSIASHDSETKYQRGMRLSGNIC